jgi:hypothetical protein
MESSFPLTSKNALSFIVPSTPFLLLMKNIHVDFLNLSSPFWLPKDDRIELNSSVQLPVLT